MDKNINEKLSDADKKKMRAERNKRYRQRLKDGTVEKKTQIRLTDEEKKDRKAQRQKNYRARLKNQENETKELNDHIVKKADTVKAKKSLTFDKFIQDALKSGKGKITQKSLIATVKRVLVLKNYMMKNNDLDWSFLNNTDAVMEAIETKYDKTSSRKSMVSGILTVLRYLKGVGDVEKFYSNELVKLSEKLDKERGNNKLNKSMDKSYKNWDDIVKAGSKLKDVEDIALHGVYTDNPPRRISDYSTMKIVPNYDATEDANFNYYINDPEDPHMIFKNYKTAKTYGEQVVEVDEELYEKLTNYINEKGRTDLLFPTNKGKVNQSFGKKITKLFDKTLGVSGLSVDLLRHSFITDMFNTPNITKNDKKEFARQMGTSIEEFENYRVVP